ncbi:MAG: bifunctional riboflavin kinase/FAD synthetase [Bacteroidota bacterium]
MILERGLDQVRRHGPAMVTTGTFDGVHRGHQHVIRYLIERARQAEMQSTVVTFEPHPRAVLTGERIPLLTTLDERAESLEALGLGRLVVIEFTKAFSRLTGEAYARDVLFERVGAREIVVGYDHEYGRDRSGNKALLHALGDELGFGVHVIPPQAVGEVVVSSTKIRRALETGDVGTAAEYLGRRYGLTGRVVPGDGRGRGIGFPTANLDPVEPAKIIPGNGVYAIRVRIDEPGEPWRGGMMNVGVRPTFDGSTDRRLEAHVFDFDGDLYGRLLRIQFVRRIRDEQRFNGVDELVVQLERDRADCINLLSTLS